MKYNVFIKAIAIILTACCLLTVALCGLGIFAFTELGIYNGDGESYYSQSRESLADALAEKVAYSYAARFVSDMPEELLVGYGYTGNLADLSQWYDLKYGKWGYSIHDVNNTLLEDSANLAQFDHQFQHSHLVESKILVLANKNDPNAFCYETSTGENLYFRWTAGPVYQVSILFDEDAISYQDGLPIEYLLLAVRWRYAIILLLVGALALGSAAAVYLCFAAGRSQKSDAIVLGGLNRLPLDIYGAVVAVAGFFVGLLFLYVLAHRCLTENNYINPGIVTLSLLLFLAVLTGLVGWCYALVAQIKMKHFYWWRHSAVGWTLGKLWRGIWFVCRSFYRIVRRLFEQLPLAWQRVVGVAALVFGLFLVRLFRSASPFFGFFAILAFVFWSVALFCYDIYCFGKLMKGAKQMAAGDLNTKISSRVLIGCYKDHAEALNTMADVAIVAAKKQMKSERMKAELVTNVSHDIKTPLTSIINYVDLLKKPHTQEEGEQYLEVLERQSLRMKKLLEDLMDMSKASTGNMPVEISRVDIREAVNQALGEFSDKLTAAQLQPLLKMPENPVYILADGKLTWRVLSNLLSNIVKYALPGTRVYLDLVPAGNTVQLSIKNISREELNISADELTERFVRGDAARNSEGSGLGLNIAQNLMDLQKGSLSLTVDGDLFKVTLTFLSPQ